MAASSASSVHGKLAQNLRELHRHGEAGRVRDGYSCLLAVT
jgi:hypothetical protein